MTEELGFEQVTGNRRRVDGDEGRVLARTVAMQGTGHKLFAGAGFTVDEHRGMGLGQAPDGAEDLLHGRRLTQNLGHRAELFDNPV
jgi:hypothetical protein